MFTKLLLSFSMTVMLWLTIIAVGAYAAADSYDETRLSQVITFD